ncbi:MAG: hypothetical protein LUB61_03285 [Eggerthellaceae bacterium]|nr:hypothetical protein [Eggerthellaceae bacterium]
MIKRYLLHAVWDFIFVCLMSLSLCYVIFDGFYVDPELQYSIIPAIGVIICLLGLYFITQSRKTMFIGGICYGVAVIIVWIISAALTPADTLFIDYESNYLIYWMIITLTPTLTFLITRTHAGSIIMFVVGSFLLAFLQLFYDRYPIGWTIIFILTSLALVIYKNYQGSLRSSAGVERVRFLPGFLVSICSVVVSVGLAVAVWFLIIAPLNPQAADIKLITEYRALETVQVRGTSDLYQTPNLDLTSDVTSEDSRTTDDIIEDLNGIPWPATGEVESEPWRKRQTTHSWALTSITSRRYLIFRQIPRTGQSI